VKRCLIISLLIFASVPSAHAWNEFGQRLIGSIAYRQLSEQQQAKVVAILTKHPRFADDFQAQVPDGLKDTEKDEWLFQQACVWPDLVATLPENERKKYDHPAWHRILVQFSFGRENREAFADKPRPNTLMSRPDAARDDLNVVQVVRLARHLLATPDTSDEQKAVMLCWLFHGVGEIHHPLNCYMIRGAKAYQDGDDAGKAFEVEGGGTLQDVWFKLKDEDLSFDGVRKAAIRTDHQIVALGSAPVTNLDEISWVSESQQLARFQMYSPEFDTQIRSQLKSGNRQPFKLSDTYRAGAKNAASRRAIIAGYRLSALLIEAVEGKFVAAQNTVATTPRSTSKGTRKTPSGPTGSKSDKTQAESKPGTGAAPPNAAPPNAAPPNAAPTNAAPTNAAPDNAPAPPASHLKASVELGEPFKQYCSGGGGRYWIFHLPKAKVLSVFDIHEAKMVKSIDVPADDILFAAGLDKFFVVVPGQKLVHRYSLPDLVRDKTVPLGNMPTPKQVLLGSASNGPLVLWNTEPAFFWNLDTLRPITFGGDPLNGGRGFGLCLSISADGQTIGSWQAGIGQQHFFASRIQRDQLATVREPAIHDGFSWMVPSADGSYFIRGGSELSDSDLNPIATENFRGVVMMPTEDPRYFLACTYPNKQPGKPVENEVIWICSFGSLEKIVSVPEVGSLRYNSAGGDDGHFGVESRMKFLPQAGLMATLPQGDREIRVLSADLKQLLAERTREFLHVVSLPPRKAAVGKPYAYTLETLTNAKQVEFKIENGPNGMAVDAKGEVRWTPRTANSGSVEHVVVSLKSASGKEAFHSFEIKVDRGATVASSKAAGAKTPAAKPANPASPVAKSDNSTKPGTSPPAAAPSDQPVKVAANRLELPAGPYHTRSGHDRRTVLLLQADRLIEFGPDGFTSQNPIKLPKSYALIAERKTHWIAVTNAPVTVDIIRKAGMKVEKSVKLQAMEPTDIVLHPTLPLAYVACKTAVSVPRYRYFLIDEAKGEGRESEDYVGTWLAVDPAGKYLLAAYKDIYENGRDVIMNPDRWHVVPSYGSIDWIIRYNLDGDGRPRLADVKENAGGNGRGLRLSTDGARVTYLSVVGSPAHSGNLSGWDPTDFGKIPVVYATKDKASTEHLAYHPFLPLAASVHSQNGTVVFDRESGDVRENICDLPADSLGSAKIVGVYFSPDGKNLILETALDEVRYLQKVELALTKAEQAANADGWRKLGAGKPVIAPKTTIPTKPMLKVGLRQLDALSGGIGAEMSAKEIGRSFMDAVVVIESDRGSGTGFVVGSEGYILTCEHCLSTGQECRVRLRSPNQSDSATATATLIAADRKRDLALVKIAGEKPLPFVQMGESGSLEAGDRVTVIGNPGLSTRTILDYTMTEGIVSNPRREIEGLQMIQSSAAVNPGSSGGPMFNDRGRVVGMVVAKAGIEAAGFAIPTSEIVEFLVRSADKNGESLRLTRQWRDASGNFSVDAQLLEVTAQQVKLKTKDGREITIERSRLCKPDQALLEAIVPAK
jgi:S1-C subfamily serine protease